MSYEGVVNAAQGFRVEVHESHESIVLAIFGRLTSEHSSFFREEARKKIIPGRRMVIDLAQVPMIDSSGLGSLATLYISARTKNAQVQVINAREQVKKLFSISNMLLLFEDAGKHGGRLI